MAGEARRVQNTRRWGLLQVFARVHLCLAFRLVPFFYFAAVDEEINLDQLKLLKRIFEVWGEEEGQSKHAATWPTCCTTFGCYVQRQAQPPRQAVLC
jgi:hypothetical protein